MSNVAEFNAPRRVVLYRYEPERPGGEVLYVVVIEHDRSDDRSGLVPWAEAEKLARLIAEEKGLPMVTDAYGGTWTGPDAA